MASADRRRGFDSWVVVGLRVVLAPLAALAVTWGAATSAGMVAAAGAAATGVVGGELLARSRARLVLAWLVAFGLLGLGFLGAWVSSGVGTVATALGPSGAIAMGDALALAGLAAGLCLGLRATGARYRAALAVEIAALGAAFAAPLAAHRDGAINRPLFVGDFAWAQGEDPVAYLEIAGAATAVGLALFLISERRWARALAAALLVGLLAVVAGVVGTMIRPAPVLAQDGLGLTGDARGEGGRGGTKGPRSADRMDFRDNYEKRGSQTPVGVVLLHDDYDPPSGMYYFRQSAFSRWNGRRLVPALSAEADGDVLGVFPAERTRAGWVPPETRRVRVDTTVAFLVDHVRPFVLEAPESVAPARNPSPRRFRRVYLATSLALDASLMELIGSEVGDPAWSRETLELYTEVPPDERYGALAERIREMLPEDLRGEPVARAAAVAQYLGERGTYSRRSDHASAADPTASFLFGDMTGYCVHFAHAGAYLYRAMGVPARVATGYAYPSADRGRGSSLLIRGGDAHAWPEIFVRDVGWVVLDVTPARITEPQMAPLDADLQRLLGEMLRGQLEEQRRASVEVGRPSFAAAAARRAAVAVGQGGGIALAAILLLLYLGKLARRLAPLAAGPRRRTRLTYRAALALLGDVGRRRRHGEPPETFAARLVPDCPSFAGLAAAASAERLGSRVAVGPGEARALGRRIAAEVRRSVPLWRRALGALDPLSWLRAR